MTEINYSLTQLLAEAGARLQIRNAILRLKTEGKLAGCNICELGSGDGTNLEFLAPENDVLGIEGLHDAAFYAQQRGIRTVVADLDRPLPLANGIFDLVLCLDVLEHLSRPERALREANRILKDGGRLIINVPNHFSLTGRIRILQGRGVHWARYFPDSHDWDNPHIRFFTQASITEVVKRSGFRLEEDWSSMVPAVPMADKLKAIGLSSLIPFLSRWRPSLFCGGFLLVARRR